tara:strand:- start:1716 stop:2396 length:681 start_codon:yes stop_codon:yes gene_type:complete
MPKQNYYAIHSGKETGVFLSWEECEKRINGYNSAIYKKFKNIDDAIYYVKHGKINTSKITDFFKPVNKINNNSNVITLYTDGSCIGNGKKNAIAGIGVYFGENDDRNISEPFIDDNQSNQRAELYAIYRALFTLKDYDDKIVIYTDSEYSIKSLTIWIKNWLKNNWKNTKGEIVKNKDLIEKCYELYIKMKVNFVHVRSHTGKTDIHSIGNDNADKLAILGAKKHI